MSRARLGWGKALGIALGLTCLHGVLVLATLGVLLLWVPSFEGLFAEMGTALPAPTILTIDASHLFRSWWFLWVPLLALGGLVDLAHLASLARFGGWLWSVLLGLLEAAALLAVPLLMAASLYLPIFTMAQAVQ